MERKRILEEEFGIPMTKKIDGMVNDMRNMHLSIEQAMDVLEIPANDYEKYSQLV